MKKAFRIFSGILLGLCPSVVALIFGILIFNAARNPLGIAICFLLISAAVWLGMLIFKKIQAIGPIDFIAAVGASPDLDNLK
jgi:hypothetical protein